MTLPAAALMVSFGWRGPIPNSPLSMLMLRDGPRRVALAFTRITASLRESGGLTSGSEGATLKLAGEAGFEPTPWR